MRKILFTLSVLFLLTWEAMAFDTLRVCTPSGPFGQTVILSQFCNSFIPVYVATLAGDTFSGIGPNYFPGGTEGVMNVWCLGGTGNPPDTSIYVIVAGRPKICLITSDTLNHAVIYVDSASLSNHTSFSLKRQINTVTWQTVVTFLQTDTLIITDAAVNTASQAYNYRIDANDFPCSDSIITTLHLQSNGSNLSWNAGGGLYLRGYYIYKLIGGIFTLIDSTANLTYTDVNYQNGDEYYVGAYKDDGCQSNSWRSISSQILVKSNRLKIATLGISSVTPQPSFLLSPNPANTSVTISIDESMIGGTVTVMDLMGRKMLAVQLATGNQQLATDNLSSGVYFVEVVSKGGRVVKQLMKQ